VGALLVRRAKKSREPCKWRRNAATINESDDQLYLGCFQQRSTATFAALPAMSLAPVAPFVVGALHIDSVCDGLLAKVLIPGNDKLLPVFFNWLKRRSVRDKVAFCEFG